MTLNDDGEDGVEGMIVDCSVPYLQCCVCCVCGTSHRGGERNPCPQRYYNFLIIYVPFTEK